MDCYRSDRFRLSHNVKHPTPYVHTWQECNLLPAQHTQNEIENKKGAEDDERHKIDPRQLIAHSILHLRERRERAEEERGRKRERWDGGVEDVRQKQVWDDWQRE